MTGPAKQPAPPGKTLVEHLLASGAVDPEKLAEGEEIADGAGLPLFRVLLHMKLVDAKAAAQAMSAFTGRAVLNLDKWVLPPAPIANFSAGLCRELRVLPLVFEAGDEGEQLVLAMSDPTDQGAGERVASLVKCNVRPVLVDDAALTRAITNRYDAPEVLLEELASAEGDPITDVVTAPDAHAAIRAAREAQLTDNTDEIEVAVEIPSDAVFRDQPVERTVIMRANPADHTVMLRNPFLDPSSASQATEMSSIIGQARVLFISPHAGARLRVAADLAPLVKDAFIVENLKEAIEKAKKGPDEVVVHGPKNDVATGALMTELARVAKMGLVVLSNDASFEDLPCVRRRLALPAKAAEIAPLIVEGIFELDHSEA